VRALVCYAWDQSGPKQAELGVTNLAPLAHLTGLRQLDGSLSEEDFKSLRSFQKRLGDLGHFYTMYSSIEDLKVKFWDQLDRVIEQTPA